MPHTRSIIVFMLASLALNLTPGPDMLYVIARSSSEGRRAGVASAFGIGAGTLVHIALVAAGLGTVFRTVPTAYVAVRLAGGAYLVLLGVRAWRASGGAARELHVPAPATRGEVFRQGVITNVLNPKVALFFLAFLPQFVEPERGSVLWQTVGLGLLFDVQGTLVNLAVASGASAIATRWKARGAGGTVLQRMTAAIFIALGVRILATAARR